MRSAKQAAHRDVQHLSPFTCITMRASSDALGGVARVESQ